MITYGLYFMTAEGKVDRIYAVTLSWVTQASFNPTVVAVRTKTDLHTNGTKKLLETLFSMFWAKDSWVQLMRF